MLIKLNAFFQTHKPYVVLTLVCLLSACSAVKLAYDHADTYLYYTLNGYVDFSRDQAPLVKEEIKRIHAWHRATELPKYAKLLASIRDIAMDDISTAQSCSFASDVTARYDALKNQFALSAEKIMPMIHHKQLQKVQKELEKSNQTWQQDWLQGTPKARLEKRFDKAVEGATKFYGPLTDDQQSMIKDNLLHSTFDAEIQYRYRRSRQAVLMDTLTRIASQPLQTIQLKEAIHDLMHYTAMEDLDAYTRYVDAMIQDTCTDFARFHNSTSATQRMHLVRRLTQYIDDFKVLQAKS